MRYGPFESPSWGRYSYDDVGDTIILQDGRWFPRPEDISKETLMRRNYDVIEIESATQVKVLDSDNNRYNITIAACNRAIELLMSARGTTSINQYILFKENRIGLNSTSPEVVGPTTIFQTIIGAQSPTIAIDRRIEDNPALAGEHPRAQWDGELTTFQIRNQVIRLNPFVSQNSCTA
jgi:DNA-directed RNA polymerase subunit K/omega